jgi:nanoRNase/pAp phosphatase (c-di-AMP/oligoRNAs hydrolase)
LGAEPAAPDQDALLTSDVATGLVFGILSDTKHLTRGVSQAEFDACSFLYPAVDNGELDRIANPQVDGEIIQIQREAIEEIEIRPAFAISDVGAVYNLVAIPWADDELMYLEGVSSVIVLGEKDETIHVSGRSRDDRVHIGRALEEALDDIPMAGGGGHARMGGGQVSVAHMNGIGPSDGMTREEFRERPFDVMANEG